MKMRKIVSIPGFIIDTGVYTVTLDEFDEFKKECLKGTIMEDAE